MDFVAIDFETASANANSACQLAAVTVRNSEIVEEASWLIRPPRLYFSPRNIAVHGIRPTQVANAPTMEEIWSTLSKILDGQVLMAHNARFDIGVLSHSLAAYDIACPNLEFSCTRALARAAWPGRRRYGLKPLGSWLNIAFQHHDALEDARCCAQIALAVAQSAEEFSLSALEKKLQLSRGLYRQGRTTGPRLLGRRRNEPLGTSRTSTDRWGFPTAQRRKSAGSIDPQSVLAAAAQSLPLAKRNIVLLGPLRGLELQASIELVERLGGHCQDHINGTTHYVVACGTSLEEAGQLVCRSVSQLQHDSETTPNDPSTIDGIRLLSERQFRALLPAGMLGVRDP